MKKIMLNKFCDLIPFLLEKAALNSTDELWFRGQKNASWELLPGAFRIDPEIEGQRLARFKMYAPALMGNYPHLNDYRRWLPIMQHFGVPTRLLDWSLSPLIALFFAVSDNDGDEDAALFMFKPREWLKDKYNVEYLHSIDSTDNDFINSLILNAFISKKENNAPLPLYTSPCFQRSFIQQSVFTIHDSLKAMDCDDENDIITKFIIPHKSIDEYKTILAGLGISEISIFSDLDTLGKWTRKLVAIR